MLLTGSTGKEGDAGKRTAGAKAKGREAGEHIWGKPISLGSSLEFEDRCCHWFDLRLSLPFWHSEDNSFSGCFEDSVSSQIRKVFKGGVWLAQ